MTQQVNIIRLECKTSGHNKFYEIWLEEPQSNQWKVMFQYGAIGNSPLQGTKTQTPVQRYEADNIYQRLMNEKLAKGYVKVGGSAPASYTNVPAKKTAPTSSYAGKYLPPMLLTAADETMLGKFLKDEDWVAQQKMNGKRVVIECHNGIVVGYNRKNQECPIPTGVAKEMKGLGNLLLDGEMVKDVFHVFDALVLADKPIVGFSYEKRCDKLVDFFLNNTSDYVQRVPHSCGFKDKKKLVDELMKNNEEGVVFKRIDAAYSPGKIENLAKAIAVKIKFYREDSFQIISWNQKSSIEIGAYDKNGNLVSVGNVTVPAKYADQIVEGYVVRVRYLYATKANQLFQPVLCPDEDGDVVQSDLLKMDCKLSKLKYEGKADAKKDDDIGRNILV